MCHAARIGSLVVYGRLGGVAKIAARISSSGGNLDGSVRVAVREVRVPGVSVTAYMEPFGVRLNGTTPYSPLWSHGGSAELRSRTTIFCRSSPRRNRSRGGAGGGCNTWASSSRTLVRIHEYGGYTRAWRRAMYSPPALSSRGSVGQPRAEGRPVECISTQIFSVRLLGPFHAVDPTVNQRGEDGALSLNGGSNCELLGHADEPEFGGTQEVLE